MVNNCIKVINGEFGYKKNNRDLQILHTINFEIDNGDFVGVVGLNGNGKSTLLKSLCGLLPVLKGEIFIEGSLISSISNNELAKKIAVVLTEKISGFNLTSFDAVASGQLPYTNIFNKLESHHLKIIEEAIEICGLKSHQHKLLSELSDGLFQKTMVAKSIAQQTRIMLLDEPSAFLDYASKHQLFILLKTLTQQKQKCIMVSSHDLDLILKYCNKILLVKNYSAQMFSVDEAKLQPAFQELTGGYL